MLFFFNKSLKILFFFFQNFILIVNIFLGFTAIFLIFLIVLISLSKLIILFLQLIEISYRFFNCRCILRFQNFKILLHLLTQVVKLDCGILLNASTSFSQLIVSVRQRIVISWLFSNCTCVLGLTIFKLLFYLPIQAFKLVGATYLIAMTRFSQLIVSFLQRSVIGCQFVFYARFFCFTIFKLLLHLLIQTVELVGTIYLIALKSFCKFIVSLLTRILIGCRFFFNARFFFFTILLHLPLQAFKLVGVAYLIVLIGFSELNVSIL